MRTITCLVVVLVSVCAEHMGGLSYADKAYAQLHRDWQEHLPSTFAAYQKSLGEKASTGSPIEQKFCHLVYSVIGYKDFTVLAKEVTDYVDQRSDVPQHSKAHLRVAFDAALASIHHTATRMFLEFAPDEERGDPPSVLYLASLTRRSIVDHPSEVRDCEMIREELMRRSCDTNTTSPFSMVSDSTSIGETIVREIRCQVFRNSKTTEL